MYMYIYVYMNDASYNDVLTTNLSTSLFRTTSERDRSTLVQIGKLSFMSKHDSLTRRHIQIQGVTVVDKRGRAIRIKSNTSFACTCTCK